MRCSIMYDSFKMTDKILAHRKQWPKVEIVVAARASANVEQTFGSRKGKAIEKGKKKEMKMKMKIKRKRE